MAYGTRMFNAAFTRISISKAESTLFLVLISTSLRSTLILSYLRLGLPEGITAKIFKEIFPSSILDT